MTHYENYKRNNIYANPACFYLFKAHDNFELEVDRQKLKEAFPEYFIEQFT